MQDSEGRFMIKISIFKWTTFVAVFIASIVLAVLFMIFLPYGSGISSIEVIIEEGSTASNISWQLKNSNLIISKLVLKVYLKASRKENHLNAGHYKFKSPISIYALTEILYEGSSESRDIMVTIPEGSTIADIQKILINYNIKSGINFQKEAFMDSRYSDFWILEDLKNGEYLEGFLFPDTYNLLSDMSSEKIIRLMLNNLQDKSESLNLDKDLNQFNSFKELIIFASIVQKESPLDDMRLISGVFSNRLKINKRLESDATINYFLGTSKLIPNYYDITTKNEYNTYLNSGLTPGAISNPGFTAIGASLNPAEHDYLFFLHTPAGKTMLSKTFEQHLSSRAIYWD